MQLEEITVVTGTRAEYGLLKSSMKRIQDTSDLSLSVVATGMHLTSQHGYTVEDIRGDGFEVSREVSMLFEEDSGIAMAKSLGIGISSMAEAFRSLPTDLVLVLGDRGEAFAAGLAAAHINIPVAHIHGGDAMEGAVIDDSIRHALTRFAHLHFPATETSAKRIQRMGEEPNRITTVGAPGLDTILSQEYDQPDTVLEQLDLDNDKPIVIVVQHPLTTEPDVAGTQIRSTLQAVTRVDCKPVLIYPNADAGGKRMVDVIEEYEQQADLRTFKSLPRRTYLGLMAVANVMIGNSSSAIIEAPSFDLPVVDIGSRQASRERADNVISVPYDAEAIQDGLEQALSEAEQCRAANCSNPYNKGGAAEQIVNRLQSVTVDDQLLRKRLTY